MTWLHGWIPLGWVVLAWCWFGTVVCRSILELILLYNYGDTSGWDFWMIWPCPNDILKIYAHWTEAYIKSNTCILSILIGYFAKTTGKQILVHSTRSFRRWLDNKIISWGEGSGLAEKPPLQCLYQNFGMTSKQKSLSLKDIIYCLALGSFMLGKIYVKLKGQISSENTSLANYSSLSK